MSIGASVDLADLRERVRDATDIVQLVGRVVKLRKAGANVWKGCCPFHAEKSPSFVVNGEGRHAGKYHCFGCGAGGDVFDFLIQTQGMGHKEAVEWLAREAGISVGEMGFEAAKGRVLRRVERRLENEDVVEKPSLPSLFQATREDCEVIAKGRGLDLESVWIAARVHKRVAVVQSWPMREKGGRWWRRDGWEQHRCWTVIDETRAVAEFRRLDNGLHTRAGGEAGPKVWSTAGKNWPIGAGSIGDRRRVLLVEGGPDMLAGYHFLRMWHTQKRPLLHEVAVVCMLGASNRIREDALGFFKGCRVRIMVDADTPKDDEVKAKRKLTGMEAAMRWSDQLTEVGAAVECFYVGDVFKAEDVAAWHEGEKLAGEIEVVVPGFVRADGAKVKDLNDLARCSEEVLGCDDVRQAFTVWDF